MCWGGNKNKVAATTPPPQQPTSFQYVNADTSNSQQKRAAVNASTDDGSSKNFGADLGNAAVPTLGDNA